MSKELEQERKAVSSDWNAAKQKDLDSKARRLKEKMRHAEEKWKERDSQRMGKDEAKTWENVKKWVGWRTTSQPE